MGEQNKENKYRLGKKHSEETKEKLSLLKQGKEPWNKGKTDVYSEDVRKKMSKNSKGQIPWNKGKKCEKLSGDNNGAKKLKGTTWKKCPETGKRIWVNGND